MRRPRPLPPELRDGPFTAAQARAAGVGPDRLRRRDVERMGRGVYRWLGPAGQAGGTRPADGQAPAGTTTAAPAGSPPVFLPRGRGSALAEHRAWRLAGLLAADPTPVLADVTAAQALGMWLPRRLAGSETLHVARRPGSAVLRHDDVRTHRPALTADEVVTLRRPSVLVAGGPPGRPSPARHLDGVRCTAPARTWRDLAARLAEDELVVLGDWLVRSSGPGRGRGWCTVEDLRASAATPGLRHAVRARRAADLVRDGAHSPVETGLRLALIAAGLPEPELQIEEWDPGFSLRRPATADLGWRRWGVVVQYEGAHHDDPAQVERDTLRDGVFLRRGIMTIRASRADRRRGFRTTVGLVRQALLERGWRP